VIIATGGWPDLLEINGAEMTTSSWSVLSGEARLTGDVLLFDEVGDQPALVCADVMARMGCSVKHISPDRASAHDLGPTNSAVVLRDLAKQGITFECFQDLISVASVGNRKEVTLRHVLTHETSVRVVDHVVVEHGISPMDGLFHDLKAGALNLGQVDQAAMVAGLNPLEAPDTEGGYLLARLGDAVAGRNAHAALYDALRICKDI
jgi:pyruvate/2-oxoglutarate dehydrogenase complex dihydrolipoamide dehydrogenase (E3) component